MEIVKTLGKDKTYDKYGGVSQKVMATVNGKKVMIKGSYKCDGESVIEYFTAKLGERLGLCVNKVDIINTGWLLGLNDVCSVHYWEEDFVKTAKAGRYHTALTGIEHDRMNLFDRIIQNSDRHDSNYGVLNDRLFIIDNGLAEIGFHYNTFTFEKIIKTIKKYRLENDKIVKEFLSITDNEFDEMLDVGEDIINWHHEEAQERIRRMVSNMIEVQEHIKKELPMLNKEVAV